MAGSLLAPKSPGTPNMLPKNSKEFSAFSGLWLCRGRASSDAGMDPGRILPLITAAGFLLCGLLYNSYGNPTSMASTSIM